MTATTNISLPTPVVVRVAERPIRASRLVSSVSSRATLPAAMGNRAFIRAWAARRAGVKLRPAK